MAILATGVDRPQHHWRRPHEAVRIPRRPDCPGHPPLRGERVRRGRSCPSTGPAPGSSRSTSRRSSPTGSIAHVAFIGDAAGDNTFKLYYAAVNGVRELPERRPPRRPTSSSRRPSPSTTGPSTGTPATRRSPSGRRDRLIVLFQGVPTASGHRGLQAVPGDHQPLQQRRHVADRGRDRRLPGSTSWREPRRSVLPGGDLRQHPPHRLRGRLDRVQATCTSPGSRSTTRPSSGGPILLSSLASSQGSQAASPAEARRATATATWCGRRTTTPARRRASTTRWSGGTAPASRTTWRSAPTQVLYGNYRWGFPDGDRWTTTEQRLRLRRRTSRTVAPGRRGRSRSPGSTHPA